eukprot:2487831-Prymnesium_polylepis.1
MEDMETKVASRRSLVARCGNEGVGTALFPPDEPWKLFPWELQLRPRSECEEQLRKAIGLRDLDQLNSLLESAGALGLHKRSSRVCFDAAELRDLLQAEGAVLRRSGSLAGLLDAQMLPPQRQKTERVRAGLAVFLERVDNDVPSAVPLSVPHVVKLRERRDGYSMFVDGDTDLTRSEAILQIVATSADVGVNDIETEQEREQEQEKQQEQTKEQEIEMERFVDLAYQRDGEEPNRWAFCALAESKGHPLRPSPLAEGTFYPASDFRLSSRSPLTLP